jgi:ABC-2 type transport system permease protein
MVGHFVRLKARLLANRLRTQSVLGVAGFVLIWVAAFAAGALGGLGVATLSRLTDEPGTVLMVFYAAMFLGWAVIPAMVSALDETLDPRRFELLPISPPRLVAGLLAAGSVGPGGLGTVLALALGTIGSYPDWSLAPMIFLVVLVELALCLVVARLVTSVFANLLASRRARELVTLAFGLVIVAVAFLPTWFDEESGFRFEITITSLDDLAGLTWLPPGALGRSLEVAAEGRFLAGLGLLFYGLAAAAVILWAWARSVRRMLETAPTSGRSGRRRSGTDRALALVPTWAPVRRGPAAAMLAKELRYLTRDNRVRAQLMGSLTGLIAIVFVAQREQLSTPYAPYLAVGLAFFFVVGTLMNQFGYEGGSFWGYVVAPAPLIDVVKGKNLTWGLLAGTVTVLAATILSVVNRDLTHWAPACLAGLAVVLLVTTTGNVASIYGAYVIPESNPFSNRGASGAVFVSVLLAMAASAVLLAPLALLVILPLVTLGPLAATVGALVGLGYALTMYRLGLRLTSRLLHERQQNLLETIDADRD